MAGITGICIARCRMKKLLNTLFVTNQEHIFQKTEKLLLLRLTEQCLCVCLFTLHCLSLSLRQETSYIVKNATRRTDLTLVGINNNISLYIFFDQNSIGNPGITQCLMDDKR